MSLASAVPMGVGWIGCGGAGDGAAGEGGEAEVVEGGEAEVAAGRNRQVAEVLGGGAETGSDAADASLALSKLLK